MELRKQSEVSEDLVNCPETTIVLPTDEVRDKLVKLYFIAKSNLETLAAIFEAVQDRTFGRAIVRKNYIIMNPDYIMTIPDKLPYMTAEIEKVYMEIIDANQLASVFQSFARSSVTGQAPHL